jgi:hypothetical protein
MAIFSEYSEISANVAPSGMLKETEPSSNLSSTFVAMSLFFEVLRTQTSHHELEYVRCSSAKPQTRKLPMVDFVDIMGKALQLVK